jgi:hypothetical protein
VGRHRLNYRLVKIHRTYAVDEVARLLDVHRNTVRQWIKQGLSVCDDRRPTLILGKSLAAFLVARRTRNRRPCGPGELYCMRCKAPGLAGAGLAEYRPLTPSSGNLVAACPRCDAPMYRRVSVAKLDSIRGDVRIVMPQGKPHIGENPEPSVNSDSNPEAAIHDNTQPE